MAVTRIKSFSGRIIPMYSGRRPPAALFLIRVDQPFMIGASAV
jgi:hypothetical protein